MLQLLLDAEMVTLFKAGLWKDTFQRARDMRCASSYRFRRCTKVRPFVIVVW